MAETTRTMNRDGQSVITEPCTSNRMRSTLSESRKGNYEACWQTSTWIISIACSQNASLRRPCCLVNNSNCWRERKDPLNARNIRVNSLQTCNQFVWKKAQTSTSRWSFSFYNFPVLTRLNHPLFIVSTN